MTIPTTRVFAAFITILSSTATLIAFALTIAGLRGFGNLLSSSKWYILGISIGAGAVRLAFHRGGWPLSIACGVFCAVVGFLVLLSFAVSHI